MDRRLIPSAAEEMFGYRRNEAVGKPIHALISPQLIKGGNTESITLVIEGENIPFDAIVDTIKNLGGSLHSIDVVEVEGSEASPKEE